MSICGVLSFLTAHAFATFFGDNIFKSGHTLTPATKEKEKVTSRNFFFYSENHNFLSLQKYTI
jgi:hypothetical protein